MVCKLNLLLFVVLLSFLHSCKGQTNSRNAGSSKPAASGLVGGGCETCEYMYIGMPADIPSTDTSAGWDEPGQKLLVTGRVMQLDGRTPASGVILYYWQTDAAGCYSPREGLDRRVVRHGHIRGWVKTGSDGRYSIYINRPAAYPGRNIPAHIHTLVKEPGIANEYYIDEWVFDDDPLLTSRKRNEGENRGGSGIFRLIDSGSLKVAEHNVILGLNIPGYPKPVADGPTSGRSIGEDSPSFMPFHAYGPDAGSRACPVCKYGRNYGILYFVGNHPDWPEIRQWLRFLEDESARRKPKLKVYFIYANPNGYSKTSREQELKALGKELGLQHIALTYLPSLTDRESEVYLNRINPEVRNTFIIYHHSSIIDKGINWKAGKESFERVRGVLESNER